MFDSALREHARGPQRACNRPATLQVDRLTRDQRPTSIKGGGAKSTGRVSVRANVHHRLATPASASANTSGALQALAFAFTFAATFSAIVSAVDAGVVSIRGDASGGAPNTFAQRARTSGRASSASAAPSSATD